LIEISPDLDVWIQRGRQTLSDVANQQLSLFGPAAKQIALAQEE